jgi:hypothetical protein
VSTCTRTGGENSHSLRLQYAELKANSCTSLTDSLYSQITRYSQITSYSEVEQRTITGGHELAFSEM